MRSTVPMHRKLDDNEGKRIRRSDEEVREGKAGRRPLRPITTDRKVQICAVRVRPYSDIYGPA